MPTVIQMNADDVLRDLAKQYIDGKLTTEEYMNVMERVCLRQAGIYE